MADTLPTTPASVRRELTDPAPAEVRTDVGEPSIAQLLSTLLTDAQTLIRKEVLLARQEFSTTLKTARQGAVLLGAGVGVMAAGGLLLLLALVYGLSAGLNLPLWLSFLIVGALLALIGSAVLASGVNQVKQVSIVPNETIESIRKDL